ncbi:hypothetical protein AMD27_16830 (plasmid) [Acinetobacter sp. TGL-Y2]|uniref:hypothetical protein n=1 Tax=Acinetobacter sp. TGL-Y2 TaxID=1407071 RepID=UPI0007A65B66|nr:hypothetical protein [Acinetobacter sp. TGL-Y2]AMW80581.1 hypothetical protein AMD27_16830 [Acinetobacter sp. TGL-Y2]
MNSKFRIYKTTDAYLKQSSDFQELLAIIDIPNLRLTGQDGTHYRINLNHFAINDAYAKFDFNKAVPEPIFWLIPMDDFIWHLVKLKSTEKRDYVRLADGKWRSFRDGLVYEIDAIEHIDNKKTFKRCHQYLFKNGYKYFSNVFVRETAKFLIRSLGDQNRRYTKLENKRTDLAAAFIENDLDGDEDNIQGYIYPA